jgi:hypothetical protein
MVYCLQETKNEKANESAQPIVAIKPKPSSAAKKDSQESEEAAPKSGPLSGKKRQFTKVLPQLKVNQLHSIRWIILTA